MNYITKTCTACGKAYEAKTARSLYCSSLCKTRLRIMRLPDGTCECCGSTFRPTRIGQKTCSASCGLRNAAPIIRELTCRRCQTTFSFTGRTKARYCSTCRAAVKVEIVMKSKAKRIPTTQIGVGSGGAQHWELSVGQTTRAERTMHRKLAREAFSEGGGQLMCAVSGAKQSIAVHHIDGDTSNNDLCNLLPLATHIHAAFHASAATAQCLRDGHTLAEAFEAVHPGVIEKHVAEVKSRRKNGEPQRAGQSDLKAGDSQSWATTTGQGQLTVPINPHEAATPSQVKI